MSNVNATHFLDMIAGGDPSALGIGGAAENQRIGPMWAGKGRADALKQEASRMRAEGRHGDLMKDVELHIYSDK